MKNDKRLSRVLAVAYLIFSGSVSGRSFENLHENSAAVQNLNTIDTIAVDSLKLKQNIQQLKGLKIINDKPLTASSTKFLSVADFQLRPKNSAQDMLRLVPGLFIAQHAGGGKAEQIFIRGFDCDHGTDVALSVDDMPVNMVSHGHGQGYADLHFLIPETVREIGVNKGPYNPLQGDFATGGAVSFVTLDSLPTGKIQLESTYVPEAERLSANRSLILFNIPEQHEKFNSYAAIDAVESKGYFQSSQRFKRLNFYTKSNYQLSQRKSVSISAGGFSSEWNASGQIPARAVESRMISRFGSIDNSEGGRTSRYNLQAKYLSRKETGTLELNGYVSRYQFNLFSNFTFFLEDSVNGDQIQQTDDRYLYGVNTKFSKPHKLFNLDNILVTGVSVRTDRIQNGLFHSIRRNRTDSVMLSKINQTSIGIYMNEVFHFNEHLRLEAGIRGDYFLYKVNNLLPDSEVGMEMKSLLGFSPKFNLIYTVNEHHQLFLNVGNGFHSNDARSVINEEDKFLPIAKGFETGYLCKSGSRFVSAVTLWSLFMENELVYVGDAGTTENRGASRRTGIDISIRVELVPWLFADADFTYAKSRFTEEFFGSVKKHDYYIPLAPVFTSAGGFTAKFNNGPEVSCRYRWLAPRPANENNSVQASGYTVVDVVAGYTLKRYSFSVAVENLFNIEWNEAQFDTESRLKGESLPVSELHFTPGTPLAAKVMVSYRI